MGRLDRIEAPWTAASFLVTDQRTFGNAWRYELVDGVVVAHAAPSPRHGQLQARVALALGRRLDDHPCILEIGSGATPLDEQRATARIPDLLIRCDGQPRVLFEVVSPSELRTRRARDRRRRDQQEIGTVEEIIEIYQDEPSVHLYRRSRDGIWAFEAFADLDATVRLTSIDLDLPLAEIYKGIGFDDPPDE